MATTHTEYCDLVMKGGITSGIVYPNAVLALSKRYTFKNIGGTSAGAIAAAATAAAALGERRRTLAGNGDAEGIAGLKRVARQLGRPGFIVGLFQPAPGSRAAFRLLTTLGSKPGVARSAMALLRAVLSAAPAETIVTFLVLVGLGWVLGRDLGLAGSVVPALLVSVVVGAAAATFRVARALRRSSMGMCPGTTAVSQGGKSQPALSDWLHDNLQQLSGQAEHPLLFEDLWNAPRLSDEPGNHAITLEMITTSISHHEPRSLPFERSSFWFHADELEKLVPKSVVDWMVAQDAAPITTGGRVYHRLPSGGQLPVLVAARMSLSFPLLISAVRLYEPDWIAAPSQTSHAVGNDDEPPKALETTDALAVGGGAQGERPRALRPCWFSDGGITSNFPIHLFDAPLPRWPTFAIDLVYPQDVPGEPEAEVFLPSENNQGWQRSFSAIERGSGVGQVAAFLFSIVATMQNWRDLLQSRAPGHRDRIVRVPLSSGEGGMNLYMDQETLERLAKKGVEAGRKLATEFNFNNHWWVRWRNVASASERFTIGVAKAVSAEPTTSYADARSTALLGEPAPPSYKMTGDQQRDAQDRLKQMIEDGLHWEDTIPDLTKGAPRPLPQLRIVPTY